MGAARTRSLAGSLLLVTGGWLAIGCSAGPSIAPALPTPASTEQLSMQPTPTAAPDVVPLEGDDAETTSTLVDESPKDPEALVELLLHRDAKVRAEAIGDLEELGLEAVKAVPVFIDLLASDPAPAVRASAATAMARIGYDEAEVFVALKEAESKDDSDVVRTTARLGFLGALSRRREERALSLEPAYVEAAIWGQDATSFQGPNWVAIGAGDDVYVTEFFGNRVQRFNSDGELLAQWGSGGEGDGEFAGPTGIAVDRDGNVYVSESQNSRVQKFAPDGTHLLTWGSQGSGPGQFSSAMGIAIDADGKVYVADHYNHRVQIFDSEGTFLAAWGEPGAGKGQLQNPIGLAIDGQGDLYVADLGNARVVKFTAEGAPLEGWDILRLGAIPVSDARGVTVSPSGDIYIASTRGNRVHRFSAKGEYLGPVGESLSSPHGTAFDSTGSLYVADTRWLVPKPSGFVGSFVQIVG